MGQEVLEGVANVFVALSEDGVGKLLEELGRGKLDARMSPQKVAQGQAEADAEEFVEPLLENLAVQEAAQQNLLVLDGIGVVDGAVAGGERIELAHHEEEHAELVEKTVRNVPRDAKAKKESQKVLIEEEQEVAEVKFMLTLASL